MSGLALLGGPPLRNKPFPTWPEVDESDKAELLAVLNNGNWWMYAYNKDELADFSQGRSRVEIFEEEFAKMHNVKYAIAVTSGSSALDICCRAIGLKQGDEVITTPYTFFATTECILNVGAIPIYVDIDPDTYNIDVNLIESAITDKTKAIIPVHFGSTLCDMDRIMDIAKKHNLLVIEDAAHSPGASLEKNRYAGSLGDIGMFSFQQSKILTSGEGGVITTNNPELAEMAWSLRHYGRNKTDLWYEHFRIGWNSRLTEFQGSILMTQLRKLPKQNQRRKDNAEILRRLIRDIPGIECISRHEKAENETYYIMCLKYNETQWNGLPREVLIDALNKEGIPCFYGYNFPLYMNPLFDENNSENNFNQSLRESNAVEIDKYADFSKLCPVVEKVCKKESIWLTQNLLLGDESDVIDIVNSFKKIYNHKNELLVE